MSTHHESPSAALVDSGITDEREETRQAYLALPFLSIRTRILAVFVLLFLLMCGITVAAIVFVSGVRTRVLFLEKAGNYVFELQQARRFEKNFLLYGSSLDEALVSVHTAESDLNRSAEETISVVGRPKYLTMKQGLSEYEQLLDEMLAASRNGRLADEASRHDIETRLRKSGSGILADAEEMVDRERIEMHAVLYTSMLAAVGFLVVMVFVMAIVVGFLSRALLRPLNRFLTYAARIGTGDYSPIHPTRKYRDEFSSLAMAINEMLHELQLRQAQLLQAGKMAAVGTLTSGIAHELNNPLNNIGITTEALVEGFDDYSRDEKLRMLEQISTQVERASSTVGNLLNFARREQLAFTDVVLRDVVESTRKLIANELDLAGVETEVDVPPDIPHVSGNFRNLQQVLINLFLNAVQAMPGGGTLSIRAAVEGELVRIDVSDTGEGIAPENLDKVFDPFFTTKEPGKGTGLGLAVSYGIIEKHRGRITLASEVGKGTTFSIFLPCRGERRDS